MPYAKLRELCSRPVAKHPWAQGHLPVPMGALSTEQLSSSNKEIKVPNDQMGKGGTGLPVAWGFIWAGGP